MAAIPVTYNGITYRSHDACIRALDLFTYDVTRYQKKTGCSFLEAIDYLVNYEEEPRPTIKAFGAEYSTVRDCAIANSIPIRRLEKALKDGLNPEDAIHKIKEDLQRPRKGIHTVFRGKEYQSQVECTNEYGVNAVTVRNRMTNTGCTFDEAMEYFLLDPSVRPYKENVGNSVVVEFRGVQYQSQKACAEAYGLRPVNVRTRSYEYEESFEEAMEHLVQYHEKKRASA